MRIVHVGYRKGLNDNEPTPKWIYTLFSNLGFFDPCPPDPGFDGLKINWKKRNYCNPPYSKKILWIKKAIEEQKKGNLTIMLLPVDTSTNWFHALVYQNAQTCFIRGRLKLDSNKHPAYASMFSIFYPYGVFSKQFKCLESNEIPLTC